MTILHLKAKHDANGNPRRLYVALDGEDVVGVWDEGYVGYNVLPGHLQPLRRFTLEITPRQYRKLKRFAE